MASDSDHRDSSVPSVERSVARVVGVYLLRKGHTVSSVTHFICISMTGELVAQGDMEVESLNEVQVKVSERSSLQVGDLDCVCLEIEIPGAGVYGDL